MSMIDDSVDSRVGAKVAQASSLHPLMKQAGCLRYFSD